MTITESHGLPLSMVHDLTIFHQVIQSFLTYQSGSDALPMIQSEELRRVFAVSARVVQPACIPYALVVTSPLQKSERLQDLDRLRHKRTPMYSNS